jgi:hypothetical protein
MYRCAIVYSYGHQNHIGLRWTIPLRTVSKFYNNLYRRFSTRYSSFGSRLNEAYTGLRPVMCIVNFFR